VFFAQEEAGRCGESLVSTEHLLLALLKDFKNQAMTVLYRLDISMIRLLHETKKQGVPGDRSPVEEVRLSPNAKQVLDFAFEEAHLLGNPFVGTEHILLGLIRESNGRAGRLLASLGAELERVRQETKRLHSETESGLKVRVYGTRHAKSMHSPVPLDFNAMVAKYDNEIFTLIYRRINDYDRAADLTQETFQTAHRHYDRIQGEFNVYANLYVIARSIMRHHGL